MFFCFVYCFFDNFFQVTNLHTDLFMDSLTDSTHYLSNNDAFITQNNNNKTVAARKFLQTENSRIPRKSETATKLTPLTAQKYMTSCGQVEDNDVTQYCGCWHVRFRRKCVGVDQDLMMRSTSHQ